MARRFSTSILAALDKSKILGIRAGDRSDHRFIGIWVVVVEDRVFRAFMDPEAGRVASHVCSTIRSARSRLAIVTSGFEQREHAAAASARRSTRPMRRSTRTPGSVRYVRGFRTPRRRETTTELMPRTLSRFSTGKSEEDHPRLRPARRRAHRRAQAGRVPLSGPRALARDLRRHRGGAVLGARDLAGPQADARDGGRA